MTSLFRYFKTSPEIIRLAVMLYVRFLLSLRKVEDLLNERGIECVAEDGEIAADFAHGFTADVYRSRIKALLTGLLNDRAGAEISDMPAS